MTPKQLLDGLRYLAEQCPVEAVCFRVPSAPSCTDHNMRINVSPRDILDLLEVIDAETNAHANPA